MSQRPTPRRDRVAALRAVIEPCCGDEARDALDELCSMALGMGEADEGEPAVESRRIVLDVLREAAEPMRLGAIHHAGVDRYSYSPTVRRWRGGWNAARALAQLVHDGRVRRVAHGVYALEIAP